MLVLDAFKCHLNQHVKDKPGAWQTVLVVILGSMTSQLRQLDVCINKPMKDHVRTVYSEWLINGSHTYTPSNRLKRASLDELAKWLAEAWTTILSATVVKSFKKCGISNVMDGVEDDMLWSVDSDKELNDRFDDSDGK